MARWQSPVSLITRYTHWLHTRFPAGTVEPLPAVGENGATSLPGVRIVGDLTRIPLLKFASDTGAKAVRAFLAEPDFAAQRGSDPDVLDIAIVGGGVAGVAAAMEAKKAGLSVGVFESTQPFSTVINFPKGKHIYTYPYSMTPTGQMQFTADVKEDLLQELENQRQAAGIEITHAHIERLERKGGELLLHRTAGAPIRARRVIVAVGRSGNHRKLNVPGEKLNKVFNRLFDPKDFAGQDVLVVGGGDSALETAIALTMCGARVTLSYRKTVFSRPKPENVVKLEVLLRDPHAHVEIEHPVSYRVDSAAGEYMTDEQPAREHTRMGSGTLRLALGTQVAEIREGEVDLVDAQGARSTIKNDVVFSMIGREAPLDFFRRSGIPIHGEWRAITIVCLLAFVAFCVLLYHWKGEAPNNELGLHTLYSNWHLLPDKVPAVLDHLGGAISAASQREGNLLYTLRKGLGNPAFYYTLAYSSIVTIFGIRRIRRRKTPYITWQTITLICVQVIPLFLLPEIILPWLGRNGFFSHGGVSQWLADHLFERYDTIGHERAYWRAYGFILAFPLNVYNVFTDKPLWLWLVICFVQTCLIIPGMIWFWGKGAYCGWICSCGALAETLGDQHRTKMPHGPVWNRVNMVGQGVLGIALGLLGLRVLGWVLPGRAGEWASYLFTLGFEKIPFLNYHWGVDILMGGIIGVGLYFWFSGRVWCRFACPLAAWMHICARFSRYRIFAEKSKCISCNICTATCHQGIDVMSFANKGLAMDDPECVRCSACVQQCPTGVLSFGRLTVKGKPVYGFLGASPVQMREGIATPDETKEQSSALAGGGHQP